MIPYRLIRSKRKTLYMQITPEGDLLVRAPQRCSKAYIDDFVASKEDWIRKNRAKVLELKQQQEAFRPIEMDTMSFCGIELKVVPGEGSTVRLDLQKREIQFPDVPVSDLKPAIGKVYRKAGMPYLKERLDYWSGVMGISYGQLKFSSALRRWGSCSAEGNINITWYLLFAPPRAIDYVLVHELAHRVEFNHSKAFWAVVEKYMPDYEQQKKVLLSVQKLLLSQGWSAK